MRLNKTALCAILIAGLSVLVLSCAGTRKNDPAISMRSQQVQLVLGAIASSLDKYHTDHGFFPKGIATLREEAYLTLDPDLERQWTFNYWTDGPAVTMVDATSTPAMPDGKGWHIVYKPTTGSFEGYGIDKFPRGKSGRGRR